MKKQKGITLIALVITIIVMLILVGVTISVSLNGGLFTTAKEATGETQIAQEKEELLMAALGTLNDNGKVDLGKLDSSLPEGFTGNNGEYTSKTGNVFKVSENGSITLAGEQEEQQPDTPEEPDEEEFYTVTITNTSGPYRVMTSSYIMEPLLNGGSQPDSSISPYISAGETTDVVMHNGAPPFIKMNYLEITVIGGIVPGFYIDNMTGGIRLVKKSDTDDSYVFEVTGNATITLHTVDND